LGIVFPDTGRQDKLLRASSAFGKILFVKLIKKLTNTCGEEGCVTRFGTGGLSWGHLAGLHFDCCKDHENHTTITCLCMDTKADMEAVLTELRKCRMMLCACCHGNDVETTSSGQSKRQGKKQAQKTGKKQKQTQETCKKCSKPSVHRNYGFCLTHRNLK
jgi:hypothetical protein